MKDYQKEIVWLLVLATITVVFIQMAFGVSAKSFLGQIDIQLHDTYFATDGVQIFAFLFINCVFWFYLIRAFFKRFRDPGINWILFVTTALLILTTSFLIRIIGTIEASSRWTVYPSEGIPESAAIFTDNSYWILNNYFLVYQLLQTIVLAIAGFMIGKHHALIERQN